MTNGEKMQLVFPDIEIWGESKDKFDYSLGGMIHRVTKSWWNEGYKEPTNKNDLEFGQDLVNTITEKIYEQVTETHDEFIFETIRPYCENVVQMKISKRELEQALLRYYGKNDLVVECIDRAELLKAMDTWDKFGYSARYGLERLDKNDKGFVPYVKYDDMVKCVKGMPSVTSQEPKTGHWIDTEFMKLKECSLCHARWSIYSIEEFDFCPSCGAKMAEKE